MSTIDVTAPPPEPTFTTATARQRIKVGQLGREIVVWGILALILALTLIPIALMLLLSLKDNGQIYARFWSLPQPYRWENYTIGFLGIWHYIVNSVLTSGVSTVMTVILSAISGYVFARHRFPGKELLYTVMLSLLMIPGLLTLIPAYVLVYRLGLVNTYWGLILPWASGGQVFGILLCRSFFATLPEEYFDAARIDGASELQALYHIAVPLSTSILVTLGVIRLVTTYNNFIWPLVVISDTPKQVVAVGLTQFTADTGVTALGPQMAAYVFATIPIVVVFLFGMRYYIQGLASGGVKA
jgi:ABC-type glycerol-3-phosphate transport system permease component